MGYGINAFGFFMLATFHSQPWMVSVALAIISTGLSLGSVGLMNMVLLAPVQKYGHFYRNDFSIEDNW